MPRRLVNTSVLSDLRLAWDNRQTRFFFWYLALSMAFTLVLGTYVLLTFDATIS